MAFLNQTTVTLGSLNATTGSIDINDADDVAIQITGTFVGTLTWTVSTDGVNFYGFAMHQSGQVTATTDVANATTSLLVSKKCAPFAYIRVIMTAYTSGSAVVDVHTSRVAK